MTAFDEIKKLLEKDRSIRRFKENLPINRKQLEDLVELTRYCASGRNLQPLKYFLIDSPENREKIFPLLAWAGYLKDWDGPSVGERPAAYLVQCLDSGLTKNCLCDDGLQIQAITLGAASLGIGACIIKAFNSPKLKEIFELPEYIEPRYVIALGYPNEIVRIEDLKGNEEDAIKYYRTSDTIHHVPKRPLQDLLLN